MNQPDGPEHISNAIKSDGFIILHDILDADFVARAKRSLQEAIDQEARYHGHTGFADYGMVLLCSLYDAVFNELFINESFLAPFEAVMGRGCIVYAYTSSSMPPASTNFSHRIHVDCPRLIPGYVTNMGATIALDDLTEENGATYFLPQSHELLDTPDPEYFFENAKRFVAPAGSVLFFNARQWHSGGANHTDRWRHALTVNMCRPFMKQRIDIPRAMQNAQIDTSTLPDRALQKLGFHAQVPASYDEYYVPPEKRKFRQAAE